MDTVTRCLHCGRLLVPMRSYSSRTELKCMFCDKLDPIETAGAAQWAGSPLAQPLSESAP
jgi:phage FluMu protein Com